ncbi:GxxExxY protein [Desulfoplanes formicivorans]|uniref:GTP-binding protein n=1 Tax=Desulfoplanes formicivorans TaxID=1592317 RepID=A0A194ABS6_9BACT|nr:GxxExxY protein [Desulfoplanes formicivorans]GAU07607.1 GTP-binding protein [Desulfoplanes formicivorans]
MLTLEKETYNILGACFQVYTTMGCGFLEAVYQECLEIEFRKRDIPFISQPVLELKYDGLLLQQKYIPDFVVYDEVIVEIKAVSELASEHKAQLLNYLHATNLEVGLLVNFGHYPKVEYKRMIL